MVGPILLINSSTHLLWLLLLAVLLLLQLQLLLLLLQEAARTPPPQLHQRLRSKVLRPRRRLLQLSTLLRRLPGVCLREDLERLRPAR
jgi:hypothetical protein